MRIRTFDEVKLDILAQHEELRSRIRALVRNAERVDLPWAHRILRLLVFRFAAQFDAHLAYEERELAPRVGQLDAWGAAREAALHAEHRDQRRRIEEVSMLAEAPGAEDHSAFCEAVLELTDRILDDMAHEEATLEELAGIDSYGHVDQMTG
jgi:hypothetical protein